MTKRAEMACNWYHLVTTMAEWEFGSAHRQNKKKIPKAEQETAQPMAARFKKPRVDLEPRPPSAARLINRMQNINRARLRLRG